MKNMTADLPARSVLLGIPVDSLTVSGALDRLFGLLESIPPEGCRMVATVNVDFVVNATGFLLHRANPELLPVLRRAALVTADGMPLVLLGRLLGAPLPERVTGADLVPLIAERAAECGRSLYFLGGTPENAAGAAEILTRRFPSLRIAGIDTPFVKLDGTPESEAQSREICERINAAHPDLVLIGFGNPKQELWLARNAARLRVPAAIGIGGTFNFICGNVKRAPRWVQRFGLEWIYRILQEPRRLWKRYGIGLLVFGGLSLEAFGASLLGRLLSPFGRSCRFKVERSGSGSIRCDCRGVVNLDNALRLEMLALRLEAASSGRGLAVENAGAALRFQLAAHRLDH